jgi:hypothetical protein
MTRTEKALAAEPSLEAEARHEALRASWAAAGSRISSRGQYRNHIPSKDLTGLLNAALDASGCLMDDRQYARALAAMESAALEE